MKRLNWLPYEDALKIVRSDAKKFQITSEKKWHYQYIANGLKPSNIPSHPQEIYKNNGWTTWANWLGTNNIRGCLRKYKVNDHFFKKWSSNMAYIFGFWLADGYIRKRIERGRCRRSGNFSISQQTKDSYILKNILLAMDSDYPICKPPTRSKGSSFEIVSEEIYNDIIKLGGTCNKSLSTQLPYIPCEFFNDFVRGVFDGDGCASMIKSKHNTCYLVSFICSGSIKFLEQLKLELEKKDIVGKIYSNGNKKKPCMKLCFGVNQTKKLGKFMYNNIENKLKLNRKFDKFIKEGKFIWDQAA